MNLKKAWLTTNRTCNNHCAWCYAQNAKVEDMDYDNAISCVDILEKIGVKTIVLIGGEPTLYKKIVELVRYIKRKNLRVAIATNGRRFSEENFARAIADLGVDSINISLKAPSEEQYVERTRDKGLYEAIRGYHNLKRYGINASLSYVVCNDDKKEIEELIRLLRENELENILFQFVKPVIEEGSQEIMSVVDMAMMTEFIYEKMQHECIPYMFEVSFPFCALKEELLNKMIDEKRISSCCHVQGEKGIVFDTNFTLLPCNHFIGKPYSDSRVADSEEAIIDIFESETAKIFRNTARRYPSEKCFECEKWNICGGGCFTRWLFTDPKECINGVKFS